MRNILEHIVNIKKQEIEYLKKCMPLEFLLEMAHLVPGDKRDFLSAVSNKDEINVIAEIKKSSPTKGVLKKDMDIQAYAALYEKSGACAISVLTEETFFSGDKVYLRIVRDMVKIPVLRKDFIIDSYQVHGSHVLGADAILLIASILSDDQLKDYLALAKEYKMYCLVETHSKKEIERAVKAGAVIIGINNRNLVDFSVDLSTTEQLKKFIPDDRIVVSESGINNYDDVARLKESGVNTILVGETIIKSNDPYLKIRELRGCFNDNDDMKKIKRMC
ncbi:MAG: indole-3-glycerol phosphate synthase TrpC [Elusimicrobiota bacterium]